MRQAPLPGTRYRVKFGKTTDGDAVAQFERWLVVTARGRYVDYSTIRVDQSDPAATFVEATTK